MNKHKKYFFVILFSLVLLIGKTSQGYCESDIPKVQAKIMESRVEVTADASTGFTIHILIPPQHHAYLDRGEGGYFIPIEFDFTDLADGGYEIVIDKKPEGEREEKVKAVVFRGEGDFLFSVKSTSPSPVSKVFQIKVQSQICNDVTNICYPPETITLNLPLFFATASGSPASGKKKKTPAVSPTPPTPPEAEQGEGATGWLLDQYHKYSKNIFISFFLMIFAGLLSAATPCVYPMLPITSAILMRRGGDSREEGIKHSLLYFLGIIIIYMILGYAAGVTGGALNVIMRSAIVNLLFAAFFAAFALALFDVFEFSFAQDFQAKIDSSASSKGGYTGTLLMGLVAGIVVSPCVGPVVFALLIEVANRIAEMNSAAMAAGQTLSLFEKSLIAGKGGFMMGGFGIGIGIPFLLVGLFSNRMPKAGTWMVYVKYLLGLAVLYFAYLYYMKGMGVARIQSDVSYAILTGIASIFASVFLGLFQPLKEKATHNEKFKKALSIVLLMLGIYCFFTGLSRTSLFMGLKSSGGGIDSGESIEKIERHGNLVWQRDFDKALALAKKENRPIFVDFYADWCANCVEFQKISLSNRELNQALGKAVLFKIYDTDPVFKVFQEDAKYPELKTGLPFFLILKSSGEFFWKGTQYNAVKTMKKMIESAVS